MSVNRELDLMDYFSRELEYLRREGKDFGKKYPQVASRLDLRESESLDPHVERLIESFAFFFAAIVTFTVAYNERLYWATTAGVRLILDSLIVVSFIVSTIVLTSTHYQTVSPLSTGRRLVRLRIWRIH